MKRFLLLLFVMISLGLSSCRRIVTSNSELIDKGEIVQIDRSDCSGSYKRDSRVMISSEFYNDVMTHTISDKDCFWDGRTLNEGDFVYVYSDTDEIVASTLSVKQAKAINSFLTDRWYDDILSMKGVWVFILVPIVLIILILVGVYGGAYEGELFCLFLMTLVYISGSSLGFDAGAKLKFVDEGYVTSMTDHKVLLDNNTVFYLDCTKDIYNKAEVTENDYVYIYKYCGGSTDPSSIFYASLDKFDSNTYDMNQVYPEKQLMTMLFSFLSLVFWGSLGLLIIRCHEKCKAKHKKKN